MESLENFCHVCQMPPSDPTKVHYKHYGGLCCFNCKAFFKYSRDKNLVDENGRSRYKCIKKGGGMTPCEVHYQAKKKCKKCRYDKCVQIGMDGDLIKQGTERQKYTRKILIGFKRKQPSDNHKILEDIVQAYESSFENTIKDNNLTQFLRAGHQPGIHWTKRHSDAMIEVINLHSNIVVEMVSKLDLFKTTLCPEDQKVLIDNNAKLYKYYIMARYFTHHSSNVTQLSWLLGSELGSSGLDMPEKSLLEVNRWAQLIPQKRHKMLARNEIFKRCLNTIGMEYQYHQSLSGLIGFLIILATNHWADCARLTLKQLEKLENLQRQAEELFLLAWNEQSDQVMTSNGQLAMLFDNLNLMSLVSRVPDDDQNENISNISTEFCTMIENQWVEHSIVKFQKCCQKNQMTELMIQCCLNSGKSNYDLYQQVKMQFYQMQIKRCNDLMADFGLTLDFEASQMFMMFCYIKIGSFYNVKDHIEWGMGNIKLEFTSDDYVQSNSRALSIYDLLKLDGAFVGKEREALQFKEIQEELSAFIEIQDVSHLFMMSLLFDSDDKRHLQHQYQRVLTKKLAENCQTLGAQNGDDAMATLTSLFKEYLTFTVKFQAV